MPVGSKFVLGLLVAGGNLIILRLSGAARSPGGLLATAFAVLILGVVIWVMSRMIRNPGPVLTFTSEGLRLHRRRQVFIPWRDIAEWKIRTYKSNDTLVIRTITGSKYSVGITWLTLPSSAVQELMARYIRMPGPGGYRN